MTNLSFDFDFLKKWGLRSNPLSSLNRREQISIVQTNKDYAVDIVPDHGLFTLGGKRGSRKKNQHECEITTKRGMKSNLAKEKERNK